MAIDPEAVPGPPAFSPIVSVAVSTFQRAHLLPRLFAALERQSLSTDRFEVVIADNGATDDTPAVLDRLARDSPLRTRILRAERNRGPAAGRNLAWRATTAPVVAFTDDDCMPTPTWLEAGLASLEAGGGVAVGRTEPAPEQAHLAQRPFARTVRVRDARWFATCNVFYRRADLDATGGFDEGFDSPAGEDTDLGLRVVALGASPVFVNTAVVHHDVRPSSFASTVRETLRWGGIVRLVRRHPETRTTLLHQHLFWKRTHPRALLAAVGIAAGVKWRLALLLALPWVRFRTRWAPLCAGPRRRWVVLPGGLVIDLLEVAVMARASVRNRTLVL